MILLINACVRKESRTRRLTEKLMNKLGDYDELVLSKMNLQPLSEEILDKRTELIASGDYSDSMFDLAKQFASADTIVIAAPYWDLGFPALLKIYLENIYVTGIVSRYGSDGKPVGLCRAQKLYYVVTAGGPYVPDYSFDYVSTLAREYFGIKAAQLIKAEMLDVDGFDAEKILCEAEAEICTE